MPDIHHPKAVARSGLIYTMALILQKALAFVYFSLVARNLGPENLGLYVFVLSFSAFFSLVADFGIVNLAIRNFSQGENQEKNNFSVFLTIRLAFASVAIVFLAITALALGYNRDLLYLLGITTFIMILDSFSAFFYTIFRARQNLLYEAIGTVIFQIIVISVGFFVLSWKPDLRFLLLVIACGSIWQITYTSIMAKKKAHISFAFKFNRTLLMAALRAAVPFFLASGFIKAYNTLDTILLKNISGDAAAGLYAIPAKVVFTFPFIAMGITAAVYPAMSNYYATGNKQRLQAIFTRTIQFLLAISLPIAVGIALLAQPIMSRIWPQFSESILGLQILIWAVVFLYLEYPFGSLLLASRMEKRNTINRAIQLGAFIILNLILIPRFGFMGAILTALITSVLIVVLGGVAARKIITIFTTETIVALSKLLLATSAMGVLIWYMRDHYSFLMVIPAAALSYGFLLLVLRVYGQEDWNWFKNLVNKKND